MSSTFGFIGTGNMGGALARAAAKSLPGDSLFLHDHFMEKAQTLAKELGCKTAQSPIETATQSNFIFLGVKPHMMGALLADLRPCLVEKSQTPPVLISMAAGLTCQQIAEMAGIDVPVIRIMPNTPVAQGVGVILYSCNSFVTDEDKQAFLSALSAAGSLYPLEESLIDAGTAVSGCGPAFAYLFIDALADGGVACGLSRNDAVQFAAQTVLGAAHMVLATEEHPAKLKNDVCSPGGSTIQGVRTLEQRAVPAACMDAVIAAFEKSRDLGKN